MALWLGAGCGRRLPGLGSVTRLPSSVVLGELWKLRTGSSSAGRGGGHGDIVSSASHGRISSSACTS